jgi:hypothetical protein
MKERICCLISSGSLKKPDRLMASACGALGPSLLPKSIGERSVVGVLLHMQGIEDLIDCCAENSDQLRRAFEAGSLFPSPLVCPEEDEKGMIDGDFGHSCLTSRNLDLCLFFPPPLRWIMLTCLEMVESIDSARGDRLNCEFAMVLSVDVQSLFFVCFEYVAVK